MPAYAFIEPRMIYDHNDVHPPHGILRVSTVDGTAFVDRAQSEVPAGDAPVNDIDPAIRRNTIVHDEMYHGSVIATLNRVQRLHPLTPPARRVLGLLLPKTGLPPDRMPKSFSDA